MAPIWSQHLVLRDSTSSGSTSSSAVMTTGTIVGIACSAAVLFLGGVILFILYWRRQRRFDTAGPYLRQGGALAAGGQGYGEDNVVYPIAPAGVIYTMDYKMDDPELGKEMMASSSSYAQSPETTRSDASSTKPLSEMASAMPAHPAYIPRAMLRGSSSIRSPTPSESATSQKPPFSMTTTPQLRQSKSRPDDLVMQAYLSAADGERVPSAILRLASPPPQQKAQFAGTDYVNFVAGAAGVGASSTSPGASSTSGVVVVVAAGPGSKHHPLLPALSIPTGAGGGSGLFSIRKYEPPGIITTTPQNNSATEKFGLQPYEPQDTYYVSPTTQQQQQQQPPRQFAQLLPPPQQHTQQTQHQPLPPQQQQYQQSRRDDSAGSFMSVLSDNRTFRERSLSSLARRMSNSMHSRDRSTSNQRSAGPNPEHAPYYYPPPVSSSAGSNIGGAGRRRQQQQQQQQRYEEIEVGLNSDIW